MAGSTHQMLESMSSNSSRTVNQRQGDSNVDEQPKPSLTPGNRPALDMQNILASCLSSGTKPKLSK